MPMTRQHFHEELQRLEASALGGLDLVEHAPTEKIFSNPDDPRTEEYITGKFG